MNETISTGIEKLDKLLGGGVSTGEVTVIAGRPGMGKTSLAVEIATNIAICKGEEVLYCDLENSPTTLAAFATSAAGCRDGDDHINMAIYTPGAKPCFSDIIRDIEEYKPKVVIIDYIQLLHGDADVVLFGLGLMSDAAFIVCSQMTRGLEIRANKRPTIEDCKITGDKNILLYRDSYYQNVPASEMEFSVYAKSASKRKMEYVGADSIPWTPEKYVSPWYHLIKGGDIE